MNLDPFEPSSPEVARLAYRLYCDSGRTPGRDLENWLQARELLMEELQRRQPSEQAICFPLHPAATRPPL